MLLREEPPASFRITEDADGSALRLQLRGELDLAAVPVLRERVRRAASREGVAVVDLSGVDFIDVAGLSALSALAREAHRGGWRLDLRHASLAVRQLARLTSMQGIWHDA